MIFIKILNFWLYENFRWKLLKSWILRVMTNGKLISRMNMGRLSSKSYLQLYHNFFQKDNTTISFLRTKFFTTFRILFIENRGIITIMFTLVRSHKIKVIVKQCTDKTLLNYYHFMIECVSEIAGNYINEFVVIVSQSKWLSDMTMTYMCIWNTLFFITHLFQTSAIHYIPL